MSLDEQISELEAKQAKVDDIRSKADDAASKIDPVANIFAEVGNYLYGVRIIGEPFDSGYLEGAASSLKSYKSSLESLSNECLVESNKLGSRIASLKAEKKRREEEAAAAARAREQAAAFAAVTPSKKSGSIGNGKYSKSR